MEVHVIKKMIYIQKIQEQFHVFVIVSVVLLLQIHRILHGVIGLILVQMQMIIMHQILHLI